MLYQNERGQHEKELSGGDPDSTNNRMELTAAIEALSALKGPCRVDFYTDSQYVRQGISEWLEGWKARGWKSGSNPIKNVDLWKRLDAAQQVHDIEWHWVKGHAGNEYNERADRLASAAIPLTLFFGLANDRRMFDLYSNLRIHVEAAYWYEATALLEHEDKSQLRKLIDRAWAKLRGDQIIIPHQEHRSFHMGIFSRLDQPFAKAILETYWEAYEAIEFNRYADFSYLEAMWTYHERIVDLIEAGDFDASLEAFIEHTQLIRHQSNIDPIAAENYGAITLKGKM